MAALRSSMILDKSGSEVKRPIFSLSMRSIPYSWGATAYRFSEEPLFVYSEFHRLTEVKELFSSSIKISQLLWGHRPSCIRLSLWDWFARWPEDGLQKCFAEGSNQAGIRKKYLARCSLVQSIILQRVVELADATWIKLAWVHVAEVIEQLLPALCRRQHESHKVASAAETHL